jgi:hypothetical protein
MIKLIPMACDHFLYDSQKRLIFSFFVLERNG